MNDAELMKRMELKADEIWQQLEVQGLADAIGGAEYARRIPALRAWLLDRDGLAPKDKS
jgi:hypothetical protein